MLLIIGTLHSCVLFDHFWSIKTAKVIPFFQFIFLPPQICPFRQEGSKKLEWKNGIWMLARHLNHKKVNLCLWKWFDLMLITLLKRVVENSKFIFFALNLDIWMDEMVIKITILLFRFLVSHQEKPLGFKLSSSSPALIFLKKFESSQKIK